jgi:hypothetical protein
LVLLFTATVVRLWVPRTPVWLIIAAGTAAAFFALGYLTPTPDGQHDDDADVADEDAERDAHIDEADIDEADIDEATMGTAHIEDADIVDADIGEPILADVDEPALVDADSSTLGDKSAD